MQLPWPFSSGTRSSTPSEGNATATAISSSAQATGTPPALTREEQADAEFADLVKEFSSSNVADDVPTATPTTSGPTAKVVRPRRVYEPQIFEDGTIDIRPEVMHPQAMNCRQQFDQAFYCQSLGGKFNDIYRYGEFKSCSEQWGAFWFCMRTRTLDDDAKAAETTAFYADRDAKRKEKHGSSEDIWDLRTRSVQRAFWKDPNMPAKDTAIKE